MRRGPPDLWDPLDDPLLPFVIAAKSGDQGAERELLLRLAPMVLEIAREAFGPHDPLVTKISLEALIATLKALPTFRGEEPVSEVVAQIALNRVSAAGRALQTSESAILTAARLRARRGPRPGDGSRVATLVDRALEDDAAVLVSHFLIRTPKAPKRRYYTVAVLAGAALISILGWLSIRNTDANSVPRAAPRAEP